MCVDREVTRQDSIEIDNNITHNKYACTYSRVLNISRDTPLQSAGHTVSRLPYLRCEILDAEPNFKLLAA